MVTREEAKKMFREDVDSYGKPKKIMSKIDIIYDSFEKDFSKQNTTHNSDYTQCEFCHGTKSFVEMQENATMMGEIATKIIIAVNM